MNQWQFIFGRLILEITCANSVDMLNSLSNSKIRLQDVVYCDDLTLRATIAQSNYRQLMALAQKKGASVKIIGTFGIRRQGAALLKRPVILAFACLVFALACYLPSRVLFVSVEGNTSIPTRLILEAAAECGIGFGASRRQVRSEVMKNELLQKIPQLQWAGINTSGCTAVISVREKTTMETQKDTENQVCSIVAARDGVIQNCTVYQGNPLCYIGQAVKAGQTLVSGYMDLGIVTRATRANAEIKALTFRELEVLTPTATAVRGELVAQKNVYALRIGKKLIKFSKDSGICDVTCAKIYSEKCLYLPGGFRLPVAIIKQTHFIYEDKQETSAATDREDWLEDFAQTHLQNTMIAGEVISAQMEVTSTDGACYLYGKYACMEMIGQVKYEQTLLKDGNNG